MKKIHIESTMSSPEVVFNFGANTLSIKGVCTPENPKLFFDPIIAAYEEYKLTHDNITIDIFLDYFNTGSSKCLLNLFIKAATNTDVNTTTINWITDCEDSELIESGQMLEEISKLKFNYVFIN